MVTSIQINDQTLLLLKKLKEETNTISYDEVIRKIVIQKNKNISNNMAGSLKKYLKKETLKDILKELKNERKKSNRF